MKRKKLPFAIGEQYELHEFELDGIETILVGDYEFDVYRYRKELINNLRVDGLKDVALYYNADILARIDYYLDRDFLNFVKDYNLPSAQRIIIFNMNLEGIFCFSIMDSKYKFIVYSG